LPFEHDLKKQRVSGVRLGLELEQHREQPKPGQPLKIIRHEVSEQGVGQSLKMGEQGVLEGRAAGSQVVDDQVAADVAVGQGQPRA
jgi:hypothetical protein